MAPKPAKLHKSTPRTAGMTLLEMIISVAIMAVIMAAILPQFQNVLASWDSRRNTAEVIQNGRVLHEHINRVLPQAAQVTDISDPDSNTGFIEFEGSDGHTYRYELSDTGYIRFGRPGSLSDLAGHVTAFNVKGFPTQNLTSPITEPQLARLVRIQTTFDNQRQAARDRDFTSSVLLYADTHAQASLIHHWRCDDLNGNKITDSIGRLDGHARNQVQLAQPAPRADLGSSVYLNADPDKGYIALGKASDIGNLRKDFTITAWVRPEPTGTKAIIIGNDSTARGFSFGLSDGWLVFTVAPNHDFHHNAQLPMYQWSHIAAVFDENCDLTFYLNAEPIATVPGSHTANTGGASINWTIGQADGTNPYKGNIDELKIFDRALTEQQIAFVYALADPLPEKGNNGNGNGDGSNNAGGNSNNNGNANGPDNNSSDNSNSSNGNANGPDENSSDNSNSGNGKSKKK